MHNFIRSLTLGISVVLVSGCQTLPSQVNNATSAKSYESEKEEFARSFLCVAKTTMYPGYLTISSALTVQGFIDLGNSKGESSILKGQSCEILKDAYQACSLSSNLNACASGYVYYANNYGEIEIKNEKLKQEEANKRLAAQNEEKLKEKERKRQEAEFMAMLNDALAREAELKNQLAWTSNALNERKLKLVNINPKSKEYIATNNEIKALEEQLPPLRYIVKLIDDYKVALENDKQQRIAAEQQRQINEQNARQQAYQQQLLDQQRAMQSEAQRQQWWNNLSNTLNRMNGVNCTSTGFGGTVYTNCR